MLKRLMSSHVLGLTSKPKSRMEAAVFAWQKPFTDYSCDLMLPTGGYVLCLCHVPAFFSALVTGFRALLTMLRLMFGAFIAARLTNLRA